jgi:hypothetical protein
VRRDNQRTFNFMLAIRPSDYPVRRTCRLAARSITLTSLLN